MTKKYLQIPDWFSVDNQGGGIAVADVDADGRQDLFVVTVDKPGGQNRGIYRMGSALDAAANVTAGGTQWIDVPDGVSWDQCAAVSVAEPRALFLSPAAVYSHS